MVYFTADMHLGHRGIITMRERPFSDVDEMNKTLIRSYNAVVNKNDTVYILGDICHHMEVDAVNKIIGKLNGKKYLIAGNHDKKYDPSLFVEVRDFMTVSLNGEYFALMHYPMLSWPKKTAAATNFMDIFMLVWIITRRIGQKEYGAMM